MMIDPGPIPGHIENRAEEKKMNNYIASNELSFFLEFSFIACLFIGVNLHLKPDIYLVTITFQPTSNGI